MPNIIRNPQSGNDVETAKAIISYFTDEIKKYNDVFEETEHYGKLHLDSVHGLIAICDDTNVSNTGRLKREINEIFNVLYLSEISSSKQQTNVNSSRAVCDIFYHFSFTQPCVSFNICIKKGAVIKCEMLDDTHVSYSDPTDKMFFDSIFNDMISRTKEKYIKAINEMNEKIQAKKRAEEEA